MPVHPFISCNDWIKFTAISDSQLVRIILIFLFGQTNSPAPVNPPFRDSRDRIFPRLLGTGPDEASRNVNSGSG